MKPKLMQGHERAITAVRYNTTGDILFSTAKDKSPHATYAANGERMGTYEGHGGALWCIDVNDDTSKLLTGAADNTMRLWEAETGVEIAQYAHKTPVRTVRFGLGGRLALCATDKLMGHPSYMSIYNVASGSDPQDEAALSTWELPDKCLVAHWGPLNDTIISGHGKGSVCVWDAETGQLRDTFWEHEDKINDMAISADGMTMLTASNDKTALLWDIQSMEILKVYNTDKPVNACAISPLFEHVILGGGQDAATVTTTSTRVGKFQVRFFHSVYEEELGSVPGHFGPINALAFSPDGRSFTSGGEDGYIRIHDFDESYFTQAEDYKQIDEAEGAGALNF